MEEKMDKSKDFDLRVHTGSPDSPHDPTGSVLKGSIMPHVRFWWLSLGVCLGLFLSMIDSSIVATSLYTIGAEFQSIASVNWVALAYTLAYLGCAVTFARFSDIIGRRNAFVIAYVVFFAFSLACGFATTLPYLIAFRALQGIGGSGLYSLSMVILSELCPSELRQYVGGVIGLVIAGSGVLGPVLGGILTNYASWRWVFWINGPIGIVSMAIFLITWPKREELPALKQRAWSEFDYLGSVLVIAASVLVVFAFQSVGESTSRTPWGEAIFIAPLIAGLVGYAAMCAWEYVAETKFADRFSPAFPLSLFRNRAYAAGAMSTLFLGYPYILLIFSFPLRAQVVSGKSALVAGLMLLPMLAASALGSGLSGKLNAKRNLLCETSLVGACMMTLGCGLLTTVSLSDDDHKAMGFLTFAGLGFGLATAAATILVSVEAPAHDHAPAQGILAQLRVLGGSLGIAASTVLVRNESDDYLTGVLSPRERMTLGGDGSRLTEPQLAAVHHAYSEAFRKGMIAATLVSAAAIFITACGYRRRRGVAGEEEELHALSRANGPTRERHSSSADLDC